VSKGTSIPANLAKVISFALLILGVIGLGIAFNLYILPRSDHLQSPPLATKQATVIPSPRELNPFSLTDHTGKPFTQESLMGKWTLFSFGYTYCPDICPTTLSSLAQVDDQLDSLDEEISRQVVFVSIDPERDTQERLSEYVPYFNPEFLGLRGTPEQLRPLTKQLGILYARVETEESAMGYLMDHSASVILTDPEGRYHAVFSSPHDAATVAEDLISIIDRYNGS